MIYISGAGGFIGRNLAKNFKSHEIIHVTNNKSKNNSDTSTVISFNDFKFNTKFSDTDILIFAGNIYLKEAVTLTQLSSMLDFSVKETVELSLAFSQKCKGTVVNFQSYFELTTKDYSEGQNYYKVTKQTQSNFLNKITGNYNNPFYQFYLYDNFGINDDRPKLIPHIKKLCREGGNLTIPKPNIVMDILPVEMQIQIFDAILRSKKPGKYSIASGKPVSLHEIGILAKKINSKINLVLGDDAEKNFIPYVSLIDEPVFNVMASLESHFLSWQ